MSCHFSNSHGTLLTLDCSSLKIYTAWYNVCGYDEEPTLKVLHSPYSQILDKAVKACHGHSNLLGRSIGKVPRHRAL
jgi:hypothetical protein